MNQPIVLCYHAVSDAWAAPLAITPAWLDRQVTMLLRLGYRPGRLNDVLMAPDAERSFAVTFDDAYCNVAREALPVLERLGVPATVFVPTGWAGAGHSVAAWAEMDPWLAAGPREEAALMDWDELRALRDAGWEIGSHTVSHPHLTRLGDDELDRELQDSKAEIEDRLGEPCASIAYPFGDVDARVVEATHRAGYRVGGALDTVRDVRERRRSTPLSWRRIGVYPSDRRARFLAKIALTEWAGRGPGQAIPDRLGPERGASALPGDAPAAARVAVVIPCFNDGVLAKDAVASVREAEPVEVVVVDDASTDPETATALDELRAEGVRVLRHEVNAGLSAARRTGLAATTAPYVFPLDSDDLLEPGALARMADRLDAVPEAAASWGDIVEFGDRERQYSLPLRLEGFRVAYRNDFPVCSLFRRTALDAVGAWQDVGGMVGYEDWNLWMTLAERGYVGLHAGPGVLAVHRRLHGPRMLGDSINRHRALYAELKRTHPRLFAEIGRHRRESALPWHKRIAYPLVFGGRPPLGIRSTVWALAGRARQALGRGR